MISEMFRSQGYFLMRLMAPWANQKLPRHSLPILCDETEPIQRKMDFWLSSLILNNFKLQQPQPEECQSPKNLFQRNLMENRVLARQLAANSPVEDFICAYQLKNAGGYLMAVFDGHGGPELARFSCQNIATYFEKAFIKCNENKDNPAARFETALFEAYDSLESECLKKVRASIKSGERKLKNSGTCALTVVVSDNQVYVANAGDSKGIIIMQDGENMSCIKLNRKFNASSKREQARLRDEFSQADIICKHPSNPNAVYVKGRLQTTRSIGDYYLKSEQFNFNPKLDNFTGPYVTHTPDVKVFPLKREYKYIVMGSDGLWDELTRFQVTKLILTSDEEDKAQMLIDKCLEKVAAKHKTTLDEIRQLPKGTKRSFHDDISVMVVDLTQQYEEGLEH